MMTDFEPFTKIARLNRDVIITEKIDGTNACVVIEPGVTHDHQDGYVAGVLVDDQFYTLAAQSRNRLLSLDSDNFGFAQWVNENAEGLVRTLGEGRHFGEWWGSGIQRGYGVPKVDRYFSLFNTHRWADLPFETADSRMPVPGLLKVPVLDRTTGDRLNQAVGCAMEDLRIGGSVASPGFKNPEGVVVYHTASNTLFKRTFEHDEKGKGQ